MTEPTKEQLAALLREAVSSNPCAMHPCGRTDCVVTRAHAVADEMDAESRKSREFQERWHAEQRARVGKFYKFRDFNFDFTRAHTDRAGAPLGGVEEFRYNAVTSCNEHGYLKGWSFYVRRRNIIMIETDASLLMSLGDEITPDEFFDAAKDLLEQIGPLLCGLGPEDLHRE